MSEVDDLPISSSCPPAFPERQCDLFRDVLAGLAQAHLPFAVAGAFAFQRYTGIWRFTKDLDVFLPRDFLPAALRICDAAGLITEMRDPVWLAKAWHGEYFVDLICGMSNAAISVTTEWIEHAWPGTVLGVNVPILGPEEMLLSKIFVTRRERFDGSDITHLIYRFGGEMNWGRVLDGIGQHWELLLWHLLLFRYVYPDSEAVPPMVWDELLARFQPIMYANPGVAFRGSLVDQKMFHIDVSEWGLPNLERELRQEVLRRDAESQNTPPEAA